jgi:hypothetical protein
MLYPLSNIETGRQIMAEHKHGEMDITTQTATFDGFVSFASKFIVFCIGLAVFLAIFRT